MSSWWNFIPTSPRRKWATLQNVASRTEDGYKTTSRMLDLLFNCLSNYLITALVFLFPFGQDLTWWIYSAWRIFLDWKTMEFRVPISDLAASPLCRKQSKFLYLFSCGPLHPLVGSFKTPHNPSSACRAWEKHTLYADLELSWSDAFTSHLKAEGLNPLILPTCEWVGSLLCTSSDLRSSIKKENPTRSSGWRALPLKWVFVNFLPKVHTC